MTQWPFTVQHKPSPEQVERLRKATTREIEQGIAKEIAGIDERRRTAEARVQTLEHECARLTEENAMLGAFTATMRDTIANDAYAATFQTMGQYRTALLAAFRTGATHD